MLSQLVEIGSLLCESHNVGEQTEILVLYVGCSFSLKQRKAIERKNGRVTPCNRPGTEELRQSQKKTEDPVSFHFVFSVLHFFVVQ